MRWWRLRQLRSRDARTRERAALKLGESRDTRAVEPLVLALKDENYNVQRAAAHALQEIGDGRAIAPLMATLQDERVWWVALDALIGFGAAAVGSLMVALRSKDDNVRGRAAQALGKIGDGRAVEPLIAVLKDTNWFVRQAAAEALGRMADARAVGPLLTLLADKAVAATVVRTLRGVLENTASQVLPEYLQMLATLDNSGWSSVPDGNAEIASHCSEIQRLAKRELFVRGLQ